MDYSILWNELSTDPLSRGYSGMTDVQIADDLNTEYRNVPRETINGTELFEATDLSEFAALNTIHREMWRTLYLGPAIFVTEGSNGRAVLAALFPAGSTTRQNLVVLAQETVPVSRAEELGLGRVYVQDIETARSRYGG